MMDLIGMEVQKIEGEEIVCQVKNGGFISNHKGVNVPGVELKMPFVSQKDYEDIVFAAEQDYDFIAASFTRTANDILEIRKILEEKGRTVYPYYCRKLKICREWRTVRRFSVWQTVS